jgi:hypothetical protein
VPVAPSNMFVNTENFPCFWFFFKDSKPPIAYYNPNFVHRNKIKKNT